MFLPGREPLPERRPKGTTVWTYGFRQADSAPERLAVSTPERQAALIDGRFHDIERIRCDYFPTDAYRTPRRSVPVQRANDHRAVKRHQRGQYAAAKRFNRQTIVHNPPAAMPANALSVAATP